MYNKCRLFPIGVLAKLTGVHVRCLRYYEKIGILNPAYVNEETGYRYYTYRQMRIIEAIQFCIELDIPLKKFSDFLSEENGYIDYTALLDYGKKMAAEKVRKMQERREFVEEMQKGVAHAEKCISEGTIIDEWTERYYYCIPYQGKATDEDFQSDMLRLVKDIESNGLRAGYDNGILLMTKNGSSQSYLFVDIKKTEKDLSQHPQIIKIPAGKYLCVSTDKSGIATEIFSKELAEKKDGYIVETEIFLGKFQYIRPIFEVRYYLGDGETVE